MAYSVIGSDGKEYGPVEVDQLKSWLAEGRLTEETTVKDFMTSRVMTLAEVPGVIDKPKPNMYAPGATGTPTPPVQPGAMPGGYAAYPRPNAQVDTSRPRAVTIIAVLVGLGGAVSIPAGLLCFAAPQFFPKFQGLALFGVYLVISGIADFAILYGLWMMKRWGAYGYTALVVLGQIIGLVTASFNVIGLGVGALCLYYIWKAYPNMS